jgi:hypothetical protein
MARRGMWLIGGMAVGVGALVLKPDSRTWLLRRLGMQPEDRRWFEEDDAGPAEHEGDEPLDTREARYSLRARLAEEGSPEPPRPAPPLAAAPPLPPQPADELTPAPPAPDFGSAPRVTAVPAPARPVEGDETVEVSLEAPAEDAPAEDAGDEPAADPASPAPPSATPWVAAAPAPAADFESVPPIGEEEPPRTPGEDTSEIEPEPSAGTDPADVEAEAEAEPPPPPTPLRPPTSPASPPPSRPFSGESTSFRSAIDAARERVHGAAREAMSDEGESTEPLEERD